MNTSASPARAAMHGGFEPAVLRAHRLFESLDLDETRERISHVMQPHKLVPLSRQPRGMRAHMDFVRVGGVGLGAIDFGGAMRVQVEEVEDYHLLMFCLRGQAQARVNGRALQIGPEQGMVCGPGGNFIADLSADCEQFVLRVDPRAIQAQCGRAIRFDEFLDMRRPGMQAWMDQLRLLVTSNALVETAQAHPLIAAELERLLLQLLLQGQAWTEEQAARTGSAPRSPAAACVRRAEDYIEGHAEQALRLGDIAQAAGVPVRTLLDAFARFREVSPMQHLRDVRLERVRARLLAAAPGTRVTEIALDCGFMHLGRFAQLYQQRFGESPSQTLVRE